MGVSPRKQLLRLGAGSPPHNLLLDRIEFRKYPVEVERIELLRCNAVGQQGDLGRPYTDPFVDRPLARKILHVEEVDPGLGHFAAERILVVTKYIG